MIRGKVKEMNDEVDQSADSEGTMHPTTKEDHAALSEVASMMQKPSFAHALLMHNKVMTHSMENRQPVLVNDVTSLMLHPYLY